MCDADAKAFAALCRKTQVFSVMLVLKLYLQQAFSITDESVLFFVDVSLT